jgi:hypothetical protein
LKPSGDDDVCSCSGGLKTLRASVDDDNFSAAFVSMTTVIFFVRERVRGGHGEKEERREH